MKRRGFLGALFGAAAAAPVIASEVVKAAHTPIRELEVVTPPQVPPPRYEWVTSSVTMGAMATVGSWTEIPNDVISVTCTSLNERGEPQFYQKLFK